MHFSLIDRTAWDREEYFQHYFSTVPCTYSMTVTLDITGIRAASRKLYPALLYALTKLVNRHDEFRTAFNRSGELGIYGDIIPCYTVFHKDSETFSNIWTPFSEDYAVFCRSDEQDLARYGHIHSMMAKPDMPENVFFVSMVPWESFDGFHLNLQKGFESLLPIFTFGRFYQKEGRWLIPLSVQVHHAVCDGFHTCRFVSELRELLAAGI